MSKCIYCGQKAGFFSNRHTKCEQLHKKGIKEYIELIGKTIVYDLDYSELNSKLEEIRKNCFIKESKHVELSTLAFEAAVDKFLEDRLLSVEEENRLNKFYSVSNLSQEQLNINGYVSRITLSSLLRNIREGNIIDQRDNIDFSLPFKFLKTEKLIWLFSNVKYLEERVATVYKGGSSGFSFRVAKGLYYRAGSFKGKAVKVKEMKDLGVGILALTDKNIYFSSTEAKIRLPLNNIISFEPYKDGLGIQKDGTNAKPQYFFNLDPWFLQNAISIL